MHDRQATGTDPSTGHEAGRASDDTAPSRWQSLAGITPVIATPFRPDESIDYAALDGELEFLLTRGARSLAVGLASEVTRLTEAERTHLASVIREALGTDRRLVVSCTADSSVAAADLGKRLAQAGADVLMVTPPRVPGAPTAAIVDYFTAVAAESGADLIVQDAPQETGVAISDETLLRLAADLPTVVAVKLESPDALDRMARLASPLAARGVGMLGGSGGAAYLDEFKRGAVGTMPGPALLDAFIEIDRLLRDGDRPAATAVMRRFDAQIKIAAEGMPAFIVAQKRLLAARGVSFPRVRRAPAAPVDPTVDASIEELCAHLPTNICAS